MRQSFKLLSTVILISAITQVGCAQQSEETAEQTTSSEQVNQLVAVIHPAEGNDVHGTVTFEKVSNGVQVHAEIEGLEEGQHGFHIHQYGDCTASDLTSAGGHYNPADNPHGAPTDAERHMGDMGNIEANAEGVTTMDYVDDVIQLTGPNGILGRAVIVHGGTDDLSSQPSGAAGPRLACGVIGLANTEQGE